ncbi:MAG TPA: BadF/BadG/BcrA/BcrD ATPase family protein [Xanthobacteraceae bacterium]|jgi:glucosamine kinase|nr:BadF/BadG/BcrA/BcrD ATPase family protein [Xanthobacteraceae bacterium]
MVEPSILLLGVDGGGTQSRARLSTYSGRLLAEAVSGPANLRLGIEASFSSVVDAARRCLDTADLAQQNISRIVACLALAGASEPGQLAAAKQYDHPFRNAVITTDAHAACIGAHGGKDGGVIVAGTGAVGWAVIKEQTYRIGGWGLPISDEGSGAWIGIEALRRVLWAHDGRIAWTPLLRVLFTKFDNDPHAIVGWTATASPRDFGAFAPSIADHALRNDVAAVELMQMSAAHIDRLAVRLVALGVVRLALVGGFAPALQPWLAGETKSRLTEPAGDAVDGALTLARSAAESLQRVA